MTVDSTSAGTSGSWIGIDNNNNTYSDYCVITGGEDNSGTGDYSAIGGGYSNMTNGYAATIGGGSSNHAAGAGAVVGGGGYDGVNYADGNMASGGASTIPGGYGNTAAAIHSFAAGSLANVQAAHNGAMLFSDDSSLSNKFNSMAADEFAVRAIGGFRFVTAIDSSGNPTQTVAISSAGNVGIGTISPGSALDLNGAFSVQGMSAPAVSPATQGRIYFDSTANKFMVSENGGSYVDLVGLALINPMTAVGDMITGSTGGAPARLPIGTVGQVLTVVSGTPAWQTPTGSAGWGLTGNMGTNPSTNFIGTTDNEPLAFRTNNQEAMRLTSGRNLGIGTTSPQNSLDVVGAAAFGTYAGVNTAPSNGFIVSGSVGIGTATPEAPLTVVSGTSITAALIGSTQGNLIFAKSGTNGFSMYSNAANYLGFYSNDSGLQPLTMNGSGIAVGNAYRNTAPPTNGAIIQGDVGIGTSSPTHLIQLSGGAYSDGSTWNPASSIRWKENIDPLTDGVETLKQLHPVAYNYKKTPTKRTMGFIAEEVGKVLPTLVDWDPKAEGYAEGYDHLAILALAVQAVKEQQRTIERLREQHEVEIEQLKSENKELRSRMDKFEQVVKKAAN